MHQSVRFLKDDPNSMFRTMRQRVNQYFVDRQIKQTGNRHLYVKTICMFALFLVPWAFAVWADVSGWLLILLYICMGIGVAGIGLCVMHDAIHGSYSTKKWINKVMGYSANLIGGNSFTWEIQHNILHHSFTNIFHLDEDIDDKPFLRLSPSGKWKPYHKFQHFYAFILYALSTLSWVTTKDFRQLAAYNKNGMTRKFGFSPSRELSIMIVSKMVYFFLLLGLPIIMGATWWMVLIAFVCHHLVSGLYITIVFQLAHVVEDTEHYEPAANGTMENSWAVHQLSTTANFATGNRLITWMVGGLNYQIEHHLFPSISHVHYPTISKIVKQTAVEYDMPYHEFKRFRNALMSHLKTLKNLGSSQIKRKGQLEELQPS